MRPGAKFVRIVRTLRDDAGRSIGVQKISDLGPYSSQDALDDAARFARDWCRMNGPDYCVELYGDKRPTLRMPSAQVIGGLF